MPLRQAVPFVPPACWSCGRQDARGEPLCRACDARLPWRGHPPVRERHLDAAWAPLRFAGPARALVHALKFRGALGVAEAMAAQIAGRLPAGLLPPGAPLVPVPADPRRARRRGFDHALLLALALGRATGTPAAPLLGRARGSAQLGAGRALRLAPGRVVARAAGPVPPAVVLVDDVWTTGATLSACAAALRAAGAEVVVAVAYARADGPLRPPVAVRS